MTDHRIHSAQELFEILNDSDECTWIEAKGQSDTTRSIMETVCSFCNEPHLGGGYILIGVAENTHESEQTYVIEGLRDPDKEQLDFASQCSSMFNHRVRPQIEVEKLDKKTF